MTPNKKVALVNPPLPVDIGHHPQFPPLGLAYMAAVLDKNGFEVKIIDCPVNHYNHENLKAELSAFQPALVGTGSMTPTIESALKCAQVAKEVCSEATVVMGGPHATFADKEVLTSEKAVDLIVRGEGEETLLEIAKRPETGQKLSDIKGITFRRDKEIIQTPNRPFIQDLDALPLPAYKLLPIEKYYVSKRKLLPIITSRGCPFACSFCVASQMFGQRFRARSPKNVLDGARVVAERVRSRGRCLPR